MESWENDKIAPLRYADTELADYCETFADNTEL